MKVLALDLSTKTGYALFEDGAQLIASGCLYTPAFEVFKVQTYPNCLINYAKSVASSVADLVSKTNPDIIVIEETNKTGRFGSRHSQKLLEWVHLLVLLTIRELWPEQAEKTILYINTSDWRKKLGLSVLNSKKAAKPYLKQYTALAKAAQGLKGKEKKKALDELKLFKQDLVKRCIHGKIDKKSISVAYVNATFGKSLFKGQNDEADAICLGMAYLNGVRTLQTEDIFNQP